MSWIIKKGDRVLVPHLEGRVNSATVTAVNGRLAGRLLVQVVVDGCSSEEGYFFDELSKMEQQ